MSSEKSAELDSHELEAIYSKYFPKVYNYVYYKLLNRDMADDLVSDIFVRIVEKIDSYDESRGELSSWIFGIARNALIDEFRRKKPTVSIDGDEQELPSDSDVQLELIKTEERRELYKLLVTISQRDRTLITMKYFAGQTNREIAAELGMNESTVSTAIWRATQRLRDGLSNFMKGDV